VEGLRERWSSVSMYFQHRPFFKMKRRGWGGTECRLIRGIEEGVMTHRFPFPVGAGGRQTRSTRGAGDPVVAARLCKEEGNPSGAGPANGPHVESF
jgi:hypothetical protein